MSTLEYQSAANESDAPIATRQVSMLRLSRWLIGYAVKRKMALLAVLGLMIVRSGFDAIKPWPMKVLFDYVLTAGAWPAWLIGIVAWLPNSTTREGLLFWCVIATILLFLGGWALSVCSTMANIQFGHRMVYDLAADLFGHLQRLSLRFHSRKSTGDLIRRVTSDTGCVSTIVSSALLPIVSAVISLGMMFFFMWQLSPQLTLLSLAIVPLMLLAFKLYAQLMLDRSYAQQEAEGKLYDLVDQSLSAIPVVQAFAREQQFDDRFGEGTDDALKAAVRATDVQLRFKVLIGLATALGTAGILWVGTGHVLAGRLELGSLLVFLAYLGSLYSPLAAIMYTSSTIQGAAGSALRVLEILEIEPEVRDAPNARSLRVIGGHVAIEGVSVGYEPGQPVLHDISLECMPGEMIAIVGPTGAGKSTLMGLIPRLFDPWSGKVKIDGQDLRDVSLASLRARIAVVQQDSFLFPMTVAQNIAYGRPEATQSEIEAAARAANADAFIRNLPQGYDTLVSERGATLSGGERQRISIARAVLKDAPILLLDEPTSSVDAQTEQQIVQALLRLIEGRTTFIIAHRMSTVRRANKLVVVDGGRIVEMGTHESLLKAGGLYSRLHSVQFETGSNPPGGPT